LGSTGVGTGVGVMPNGKAFLGGSAVALVGVGRSNLNPTVAEVGASAGTPAFGAVVAEGGPKVKGLVLEASVDPLAGNSNSFGATVLDFSPSPGGGATGNDGMLIGEVVGSAAVDVGADSFIGDPLSISSSRVGGVLVFSLAMVAGVGCGLGAAVGAVNTIVGADAERVIGAV